MDCLTYTDDVAPPEASSGFGQLRSAVLEAYLLGGHAAVPRSVGPALAAWCMDLIGDVRGVPRGLELADVPKDWVDTLRWAGVPIVRGGELYWGTDVRIDDKVDRPQLQGPQLVLPTMGALLECSGLGIKPVRSWVHQRLGVRLQAAPGLRLYLWESHGLVISHLDLPVGGFLYGPGVGTRMGLTIEPGSWQVVPW